MAPDIPGWLPDLGMLLTGSLLAGAGWLLQRYFRKGDRSAEAERAYRHAMFEAAAGLYDELHAALTECWEQRRDLETENHRLRRELAVYRDGVSE